MATLASDLARALDPVLLAQQAGIEPDLWQAEVLRSTAPRILLNCSRQSGKSTVTGLLGLHTALYEPGSLTLILARAERQAAELFRKTLHAYRALGRPVPATKENELGLELATGSRIIALPGKEGTIRSYSGVRRLIIDEASRVPDDLYMAVRPMLAVSGGSLVALSTPFGTRGWWYEAWRSKAPWERYQITAEQCPRISAEFLDDERRDVGEWWFRQEYFGEFLDSQTAAFRSEDIERAFSQEVETWAL